MRVDSLFQLFSVSDSCVQNEISLQLMSKERGIQPVSPYTINEGVDVLR